VRRAAGGGNGRLYMQTVGTTAVTKVVGDISANIFVPTGWPCIDQCMRWVRILVGNICYEHCRIETFWAPVQKEIDTPVRSPPTGT